MMKQEKSFYWILCLVVANIFMGNAISIAHENPDVVDSNRLEVKRLLNKCKFALSENDSIVFDYCYEALKVAKTTNDNCLELECYNHLIQSCIQFSKLEEAKSFTKSIEDIIYKCRDIEQISIFYQNIGITHIKLLEYDLAEFFLTKSKKGYQQIGQTDSLHTIYIALAHSHKYQFEYNEAAKNANLALNLAIEKNDSLKIALSKRKLGEILAEQGKLKMALEYFFENLEYFRSIENSKETGVELNNIALTYHFMGENTLSISYSEKSMAIRRKIKDMEGLAESYNNISLPYLKQEKWDIGLKYLTKSLEYFKQVNNYENIPILLTSIGNIKLKQKLFAEAKKYFEQAYSIEKQSNRLVANYRYHNSLYILYLQISDYKNALKHHESYIIYKDSIDYSEQQRYIADLNIKYNVEKKEKQLEINNQKIQILEVSNELKDIKLSNQETWLRVLIGGSIIILAFFFLIAFQMLKKNRAYKALVNKNAEIAKSEKMFNKLLNVKSSDNQNHIEEETEATQTKYADSQLTDEQKKQLIKLILATMKDGKPYLDKALTLESFSLLIGYSRSYISQVINEELNLNFRSFVNQYRIKDAMLMLSDPSNKYFTIETIGNNVGFGSKSAFYAAFKAYTGITPTYYIKSLNKK